MPKVEERESVFELPRTGRLSPGLTPRMSDVVRFTSARGEVWPAMVVKDGTEPRGPLNLFVMGQAFGLLTDVRHVSRAEPAERSWDWLPE